MEVKDVDDAMEGHNVTKKPTCEASREEANEQARREAAQEKAINKTNEEEAKAAKEEAVKEAAKAKAAEEEEAKKKATKVKADKEATIKKADKGNTVAQAKDNEDDVEETVDVDQVLNKLSSMSFLNTSTRSKTKEKEADKGSESENEEMVDARIMKVVFYEGSVSGNEGLLVAKAKKPTKMKKYSEGSSLKAKNDKDE
ncbi:hypothetical protein Tco_1293223 [Tanacetum coccineum]